MRIGAGGVSIFTVVDVDGDQAVIEAADAAVPGRYPFGMRVADLVPVRTATGLDGGAEPV